MITNLASALPFIGSPFVEFIWGGFSVGHPTLNRFFSLHYLLPFAISGLVVLHLIVLHLAGSSNPEGITADMTLTRLNQLYATKDLFGMGILLALLSFLVAFTPNALGHTDNYIPANPLVTPAHIVPE